MTGRPFVQLVAAEGDWQGCQAYPKYVLSVYAEFRAGKVLQDALVSPKNVSFACSSFDFDFLNSSDTWH